MSATNLIDKLVEIERVLGSKAETATLRRLVQEAQSSVLEIQRQMIDTLRENGRLRERMERCESIKRTRPHEIRLPSNAMIAQDLAGRPKPVASEEAEPVPQWLSVS